jgi:hypothetical protein
MAGIAKLTGIQLDKYDLPSSDLDADPLSENVVSSEDEIYREKRKAAAADLAKELFSKGQQSDKSKKAAATAAPAAAPTPKKWGLGGFKSTVMQSFKKGPSEGPDSESNVVPVHLRQDTTDSEEEQQARGNMKFGASAFSKVRSVRDDSRCGVCVRTSPRTPLCCTPMLSLSPLALSPSSPSVNLTRGRAGTSAEEVAARSHPSRRGDQRVRDGLGHGRRGQPGQQAPGHVDAEAACGQHVGLERAQQPHCQEPQQPGGCHYIILAPLSHALRIS